MSAEHKATDTRHKWMGMIVILAVLLFASAGSSHAWGGHHGGGGHHRFRGHHRVFGPHVFVGIAPYWVPYSYPPVVVPPAPVYVPPSPPGPTPYWYYCDNPPGYYPYVQQGPGGWRPVVPTPPQ
jgi:hypothetical protein